MSKSCCMTTCKEAWNEMTRTHLPVSHLTIVLIRRGAILDAPLKQYVTRVGRQTEDPRRGDFHWANTRNIPNEVHLYWKWDTPLLQPSLHDTHRFSAIQIRTGRRKLPRNQISLSLWYYGFQRKEFYSRCQSNWWCNLFPATYRLHMGECMSKKCCKKNTFSS